MPPPPSPPSLAALLDLSFDHVCALPLSALVSPASVLPTLDLALRADRVADAQTRILAPLRERLLARAERSSLTLAAWLPAKLADAIADRLGKPAPIPKKMIDEVVASEKVRDAVRAMLSESLTNFVKGSSTGEPAAGGLRGALGFGARAVSAAGKGLLGGIGDELQKKLQERVRDFVDASVTSLQKKIAERLSSDETAKALGKRRRDAFLSLLQTTEPKAAETIRQGENAELDAAIPAVVAHNLARAEVRAAITEEVAAVIDELSKESIGALLDRAGLREAARMMLHAQALPIATALVGTAAFTAWWEQATGARG